MCSSKENGGLGVRDLSLVNKALLGKWVWRFAEEENTIWKDMIRLKYLVEDGLLKLLQERDCLHKAELCFSIGDGSTVRFWENTWCGKNPLCDTFPALFMLTITKGVTEAEIWDNTRGDGEWSPRFSWLFND